MSELHDVRLVAIRNAAEGLVALTIDTSGTPLVGTHAQPGQYVKVSAAALPANFFALASEPKPNGHLLELLVKRGSPLADALASSEAGATVEVSAPMGRGFPLDHARNKDVLLLATGSGISPIRSLIGALRAERHAYGDVTLYWGAKTPASFAYADEWAAWERDGVRVVRTVSRPSEVEWSGPTGYVQTHLRDHEYARSVAFLCGQKAMLEAAKAELGRRGMDAAAMFTNF